MNDGYGAVVAVEIAVSNAGAEMTYIRESGYRQWVSFYSSVSAARKAVRTAIAHGALLDTTPVNVVK